MKIKRTKSLWRLIAMVQMLMLTANSGILQAQVPVVYHNLTVENSREYQKGNAYQRDLLLFCDLIKTSHPAFSKQIPDPFDIDSIVRAGYRAIKKMKDNATFGSYLQQIMSRLHDGHSQVYNNNDSDLEYPFRYYEDNGRYFLRSAERRYKSWIGKEIVKINGRPTNEVMEAFHGDMSYDNEDRYHFVLTWNLMNCNIWKNKPFARKDGTLMLEFADTAELFLSPSNSDSLDWATAFKGVRRPKYFSYDIDSARSICRLRISKMDDRQAQELYYRMSGEEITPDIEKKLSAVPLFNDTLQAMFCDMATQNIRTLVVDMRNNGGGDSSLGDRLLSWLKPLRQTRKGIYYMRISSLMHTFYQGIVNQLDPVVMKHLKSLNLDSLYNQELQPLDINNITENKISEDDIQDYTPPHYNCDESKIYKGRVIFLQDEATFSSAGDLITDAIDNGVGMVVGTRSTYNSNSYGDILYWELPNTHLKGGISFKIFFRPDVTKMRNEDTIVPDVIIRNSWNDRLTERDPCMEWVYENCK